MDKIDFSRLVSEFRHNDKDTGSTEVQIVLLSEELAKIQSHFKRNPKDFSAQRGLLKVVGRRYRFLRYLKRTNLESYNGVTTALKLRKK